MRKTFSVDSVVFECIVDSADSVVGSVRRRFQNRTHVRF